MIHGILGLAGSYSGDQARETSDLFQLQSCEGRKTAGCFPRFLVRAVDFFPDSSCIPPQTQKSTILPTWPANWPNGCVRSSPLVLWSKALERSSMGLPPSAAEQAMRRKHHLHHLLLVGAFWGLFLGLVLGLRPCACGLAPVMLVMRVMLGMLLGSCSRLEKCKAFTAKKPSKPTASVCVHACVLHVCACLQA